MKEFHPFRLDFADECLWRGQDRISLTPKSFSLLAHLVERAGNLVPQSEIIEKLWPDTFVQPEVLKSHIRDLRSLLGDDARHPQFIETCHRRGYRFIAQVQDLEAPAKGSPVTVANLVGRDNCLQALKDAFQNACEAGPQLVFVTGEIGIGKTTLLNVFENDIRHRLPHVAITRGQCVEGFGGREPYYPILEALSVLLRTGDWETVVDVLAQHAPTWLAQFPGKIQGDRRETLNSEVAGATTERMLREFFDATEVLAQDTPLILLLEDVHWADNYTVDWFSAFARGHRSAKLMAVATLRKLDLILTKHPLRQIKERLLAYHLCREVHVSPLGEPDVQTYLEQRLPDRTFPAGLAGILYRHSEGNPLFLEATLEQLISDGFLTHDAGGLVAKRPLAEISTVVPETLSQIVEVHIESHLRSIEQEVLEAASACGPTFSIGLVAAAAEGEPEEIETVCTQLAQRSQVIRSAGEIHYPDGTVSSQFEFVHALYCQIFYRRLGRATKERLHTSIGRKLLSLYDGHVEEIASVLAYHFEKGSAWEMVPRFLLATARTECHRFAFDAAITALKRAQKMLPRIPDAERNALQPEILIQLAHCYAAKDDFARASEALEGADKSLALQNQNKRRIKVLLRLAFMLSRIDARRCANAAKHALEVAIQEKDPLLITEAKGGSLFWKIACDGWNAHASDLFSDALESMRMGPDQILYGIGLVWDAMLKGFSSHYLDGLSSIRTAAGLLRGADVFIGKDVPQIEISLRLLSGELGSALTIADSHLESARKDGNRIRECLCEALRAWIFFEALDWEQSIEICERVSPHLKSPGTVSIRKVNALFLGASEAKLGRFQDAHRHLAEVESLQEEYPTWMDWHWRLLLLQAEADLALAAKNGKAHDAVSRFLSAALATEERTWQALAWETDARVALDEDALAHARKSIVHALDITEKEDLPLARWRVEMTAMRLFSQNAARHRRNAHDAIRRIADSLANYPALSERFSSRLTNSEPTSALRYEELVEMNRLGREYSEPGGLNVRARTT